MCNKSLNYFFEPRPVVLVVQATHPRVSKAYALNNFSFYCQFIKTEFRSIPSTTKNVNNHTSTYESPRWLLTPASFNSIKITL